MDALHEARLRILDALATFPDGPLAGHCYVERRRIASEIQRGEESRAQEFYRGSRRHEALINEERKAAFTSDLDFLEQRRATSRKLGYGGDDTFADIARGVMSALDNPLRGIEARSFAEAHRAGMIARDVAWTAWEAAWNHDHQWVFPAFRYDLMAIALVFEELAPAPAGLPEEVEIFRGTANGSWSARYGLSWSLSLDAAEFFATYFQTAHRFRCPAAWVHKTYGTPTVWRAVVPREWIAALIDDDDVIETPNGGPKEREVILSRQGLANIRAGRFKRVERTPDCTDHPAAQGVW